MSSEYWNVLQGHLTERLSAILGTDDSIIGPLGHERAELRLLAAWRALRASGYLPIPVAPVSPNRTLSRGDIAALHGVLRTVYLAELVFGDAHRARQWLCAPKTKLQGRVPLMLSAYAGHAQGLELWLKEINEGCYR
ncbi:DUF2384 domain-containing protein [Bordetella petrii]|nr:DUF2384 domain-containing protein [Bordetella petrii]